MTIGRPDDIGNFDGTVENIEDRNTNRNEVTFATPVNVPPGEEVKRLITESEATIVPTLRQYLLKGVLDDTILGVLFIGGEEVGDILSIAKPPHLQRTRFDNKTIVGIEYTYISVNERMRTRTININVISDIQFVEPPYVFGDDDNEAEIFYASTVEATGLIDAPNLIDINLESRVWSQPLQLKAYVVMVIDDDTLVVQAVDEETPNLITIAKSPELQRTPFDGQTIGGFTYSYASGLARNVVKDADSEDQVIIPQYDVGITVVYVMEPVGGTGVVFNDKDVLLIDINAGGRMWATLPEDIED